MWFQAIFPFQVDSQASKVNIKDYDFEFENLVFEGGGNKGLAYCGAIRVKTMLC